MSGLPYSKHDFIDQDPPDHDPLTEDLRRDREEIARHTVALSDEGIPQRDEDGTKISFVVFEHLAKGDLRFIGQAWAFSDDDACQEMLPSGAKDRERSGTLVAIPSEDIRGHVYEAEVPRVPIEWKPKLTTQPYDYPF